MQSFGYLCTCCGWFNRCVCAASLYDVCIYFFSLGFRSSIGAIREIGFKFPANKHTCISCTRTRLDYKLDRKMFCLTPCIRLIFKTCVSSIIFFLYAFIIIWICLSHSWFFVLNCIFCWAFFYNSLTYSLLFLIYQRICPFSNDERSNKKPTDNDNNNNASNNSNNVDDKNRSI